MAACFQGIKPAINFNQITVFFAANFAKAGWGSEGRF
jgi:hypothetical protein